MIAIPGSFNSSHIAENFVSQDFVLTADEMERICELDKDERFFVAFEGVSFE